MVMADQDINFVVVGRNTEQWQASVQDFNEEEFSDSPTSPKGTMFESSNDSSRFFV